MSPSLSDEPCHGHGAKCCRGPRRSPTGGGKAAAAESGGGDVALALASASDQTDLESTATVTEATLLVDDEVDGPACWSCLGPVNPCRALCFHLRRADGTEEVVRVTHVLREGKVKGELTAAQDAVSPSATAPGTSARYQPPCCRDYAKAQAAQTPLRRALNCVATLVCTTLIEVGFEQRVR